MESPPSPSISPSASSQSHILPPTGKTRLHTHTHSMTVIIAKGHFYINVMQKLDAAACPLSQSLSRHSAATFKHLQLVIWTEALSNLTLIPAVIFLLSSLFSFFEPSSCGSARTFPPPGFTVRAQHFGCHTIKFCLIVQ